MRVIVLYAVKPNMEMRLILVLVCWNFKTLIGASGYKCSSLGGSCQKDNLACSGSYVSGLCDGQDSERCCVRKLKQTIDCAVGSRRYSAVGSTYYSDLILRICEPLQDFLSGRSSVVTVAMDARTGVRYDENVCIPQLNRKFGRVIDFRVQSTSINADTNNSFSKISVCVLERSDSYDSTINGPLTLVLA